MTLVSDDMTSGEMTFGRLDRNSTALPSTLPLILSKQGVLTIYIGNQKFCLRNQMARAMGWDLRRCNFSTLLSLFRWFGYTLELLSSRPKVISPETRVTSPEIFIMSPLILSHVARNFIMLKKILKSKLKENSCGILLICVYILKFNIVFSLSYSTQAKVPFYSKVFFCNFIGYLER